MSGAERNRRILAHLLAAVAVGGSASALVPQHTLTISRVLAVAVVGLTGGLLLATVGRFVAAEPPRTSLDSLPRSGAPPLDPHGLRDARRDLDRPAAPGSLPAPVWERLSVAFRMHLHAQGVDPTSPAGVAAAGARLRPETWELLSASPASGFARDRAGAAAIVHRTLDDLVALDRPNGAAHGGR